jgi:hypothetical protein
MRELFTLSASLALAATVGSSAVLASTLNVPASYLTIQAAINAAQPGDEVMVAPGAYTGPGNVDLNFGGKAIIVRSSGGAATCTIDANGTTENPHRGFVFSNGETATAVVDGFTIRRGATRNGAIDDQFNGAAILCNGLSAPTIRNCVMENNHAACWGGAVCCSDASPTLINCTIRNNTVGDDGGALFSWGNGQPTLINCLLANNVSGSTGGAITSFNNNGGTIHIQNCTIAGNSAYYGTAIYGWYLDVDNTLIWGNTGSTIHVYQNSTNSVRYSNVQGGYAGAGNINMDPQFADAAAGDFRLTAGSPAIDAGDNTAVPAGTLVDADGAPRFQNDPGTADTGIGDGVHAAVDIGVFEFAGNSCPGDTDGDHDVDLSDLTTVLALFGSSGSSPPADVDRDSDVDIGDLALLLAHFGSTCD